MSEIVIKSDPHFEKNIQKMEALLLHSVCGVHALFRNHEITSAVRLTPKPSNAPEHHKRVESLIANLISHNSLHDKVNYLKSLDAESHSLLVHTYLEIVEGAVRNLHPQIH